MALPFLGLSGRRAAHRAAPGGSAAGRLLESRRDEAMRAVSLTTLAQAYLANETVFLERGSSWCWDRDGIPDWLVPRFEELGLLP
ncbi:hypothetical protein EVJ50_06365 [Synechococcus sp. RSCCF101]|uniref:hypothetical protein n=1 Tax=Synechococcus sp. RSCCF101 TaxID=2511069 RepID=UPI001244D7C5|nr:hypothetical protein [Synechococcus sp. RSCCF101]QEY31921.1 hypothetical protein EVJ50_06365 [Synechococcus sp. RSCCF101]